MLMELKLRNSILIPFKTGDNESRAIIQPQSLNDPLVKELISTLIDWINDELAEERIIVKNIEEDLYDGQILHKLLEKLTGRKLDVPEVTQSEEGQRQKLQIVLNAVNHVIFNTSILSEFLELYLILNRLNVFRLLDFIKNCQNGILKVFIQRIWWPFYIYSLRWFVTSVHQSVCRRMCMSLLSSLRRMVQFWAHRSFKSNSLHNMMMLVWDVNEMHSTHYSIVLQTNWPLSKRWVFSLHLRKIKRKICLKSEWNLNWFCYFQSLITFVNKHLNKLNFEVTNLATDFKDGVYLCLLMGLLGGFFVPLYEFHLTPKNIEHMVN